MITEFRGQWTKFSNYSHCSIWYEGHIYPSVEHAYQAAKSLNEEERRKIRHLPTANQAKQAGKKIDLRKDWDKVKLQIMEILVREKFSQEPERSILLSSKNEELIEGNWWGDKFWGQSPLGNGQNHLGKLLMKIREEMQTGKF
jgi:hypothetical protein